MRRRRYKRFRGDWVAAFAIAFGLGVFLALFCSLRLIIAIAVAALVYLGIQSCY